MSFIKAYQHLAEVRGRFDAWVFRIVANGCKDWLKNIRRTHLSYDEDDQPSGYATPEEDLDRTELRGDLDRALAALAPSLREAFVMKHVEGRSYEGDGRFTGYHRWGSQDARASRARGAPGSSRGEIRLMHDDLTARDGREDPNRSRAPEGAEVEPARPSRLSDREVPIELTRTPDQVHAWLDGELPETVGARS